MLYIHTYNRDRTKPRRSPPPIYDKVIHSRSVPHLTNSHLAEDNTNRYVSGTITQHYIISYFARYILLAIYHQKNGFANIHKYLCLISINTALIGE